MWPLAAIWCDPCAEKGLTTEATCGRVRNSSTSFAVVAWLAASLTGSVVEITTWAGLPACEGSLAARMFCTWDDSELPELRLDEKLVPSAWARTLTATRDPNQMSSTSQRWA